MSRKVNKEKQNIKKKYKGLNIATGILFGMFLTVSIYLIYNLIKLSGIENIIRYIVIFLLGFFDIFLILKYFKMRFRPLIRKYILFIFAIAIFGSLEFFIAYTINKGLNVVDNISQQKFKTYKTSLIALKSSNLTLEDINNETKIGRVNDDSDIENYVLTKYLIEKDDIKSNQIEDYDDPITMLYDLYENKIDAVFISGSYINIYQTMEKFENISTEVVELDKYSKKMRVKSSKATTASTKNVKDPFTILLMGVDSTEENLSDSSGLGDSLILITFNPQTLNATILSIPRDTFVPISCYKNVRSKITHAASGGDKCMITTIQNFFDVNIDYYAKINFRGLIKLVDALGGIDVEVPYSFCETDENRLLANTVYVEKGMQHLDGEHALALTRNRKTYPTCGAKWNEGTRNDFVRGQNQQIVINGIINKAKSIDSIDQFYAVLDAVGGSLTTNMDRKQILSFYNVFKNILLYSKDLTDENNIIDMQKLYLNGEGAYIRDGIMSSMNLYEYVPSTESLKAIQKAMKVNLGLIEDEPNKIFSFSSDEEYVQKVIGKNLTGGIGKYEKLPETTENTETDASKCGTNEELGGDGVTCVCLNGYSKENGVCTKQKVVCDSNKQLRADGVSCECKPDYKKSDGTCSTKPVSTEEEDEEDETTNSITNSQTTTNDDNNGQGTSPNNSQSNDPDPDQDPSND